MLVVLALVGLFVLPEPWNIVVLAAAVALEAGEIVFWRRFLRRYRVRMGPEALVGELAEVVERCDASTGVVRIRGELWNARCETGAERGERVAVESVEGLMLRVVPGGQHNSG